ncbi:hypothetical protein [Streptomyces dysideae]|uniref:Prenyltransferase n=1 Tax=Streptomyces dysideae TaxID=909626 RepID=A0A101V1E5_9ACTN|nr:hypothetical protein [Streptomyces dysideae]KUO20684.1 hypothetical protein AQJ91_12195 [Streptomyces dysideae]
MTVLGKLGRFVLAVFTPQVYVTYGVLWALALEGTAALLAQGSWQPSAGTAVRAATVVLALLYLRMIDEQKDMEYDRMHNPGRPLVTGAVTQRELRVAMVVLAALLVALNAGLPAAALLVLLCQLVYALGLVALERASARVREGLLLNLAVTYPVQLLLSCYVYLSAEGEQGSWLGWRAIPLVGVFVAVFLHFEFARKTSWSGAGNARLYSGRLGPLGSAGTAMGCAVLAAALQLTLLRPWRESGADAAWALLPYAALVFPLLALPRFLRRRTGAWPVPLAMGYVVTSYLTLTIQAGAL